MSAKTILAVQGAGNEIIQSLLTARARAWAASGARVVGLVEAPAAGARGRWLCDLETGAEYGIDQDLGPGSRACRLTGSGIAEACEAVRRRIALGCDVVVLSKFGKLEAERSGLVAAFAAAVEAGVPVLTAVSPTFAEQWLRFAGPLAAYAPPSSVTLDAWWASVRPASLREPEPLALDGFDARQPSWQASLH